MAALSNSPCITIGDVVIQQDDEGRYSLKDLHLAAGGEKRHQPGDWMRIQQTQDLIAELQKGDVPGIPGTEQKQPVKIIQGGDPKKQGTYVVRELVYAYAMWISAAFHLKVIRTFDAVMTGHVAAVETLLPSEAQTLKEIVDAKLAHLPPELQQKGRGEVWSRVQNKFRANSYTLIPRTRLAEAILYVTQMTLRGVPSTPVTPEPMPEPLSAHQYDELTRTLRPSHWLLNGDGVQTAIHDRVRVTFGVRHIKDIPAAQFAPAMLLAKDINARCQIIGRVGSEFLDEMVRAFIAAEGTLHPGAGPPVQAEVQGRCPEVSQLAGDPAADPIRQAHRPGEVPC
ncbi:MAG: KilA-N domain-containing protein [Chromatiales bacterium]|nr:KilA-N domain-containing protein [Chromatiales bacterium]